MLPTSFDFGPEKKVWFSFRNYSNDNNEIVSSGGIKILDYNNADEQPKISIAYSVGQTVRINEAPFLDFMGIIEEVYADRSKVKVLVSFFGRETPVELDFVQVERI